MRRSTPTVLALALSSAPALAQAPTLDFDNGVVGEGVSYAVDAAPGTLFVLVPSFQSGPTPLALYDPSSPEVLEVGLDLINFATIGLAPGGATYPIPANPNLEGLVFHAQAFTLTPTALVDQVTNPTRFTLGASDFISETLEPNFVARQGHTLTTTADGQSAVAIGGL